MSDVTQILNSIEQGDPHAAEQLLPLVYDELRKLASQKLVHEAPGQTLQATALVHEAYIRLVGSDKLKHWEGRGHFFAAAAESMRRILINRARDKKRLKRGAGRQRVDLDQISVADNATEDDLIALDEALDQLAETNATGAELVKLRFFGGLSQQEAADCLGISRRTANRYWAFAKAWLYDAMSKNSDPQQENS